MSNKKVAQTAKDVLYIEDGVMKVREGVKPSEGSAFLIALFNEEVTALRQENEFRGVINSSFSNYFAHIKGQTLGFEQELNNYIESVKKVVTAPVEETVEEQAQGEEPPNA